MSVPATPFSLESDSDSGFEDDSPLYQKKQMAKTEREIIKNKPFDEAFDVSMDTADVSSPEKGETPQKQTVNHYTNQRFDETLDVTQSTGEHMETPESKDSPSSHTKRAATSKELEHFSDGETGVQKSQLRNEKIINDRFDAAFDVNSDSDNASVDTTEQDHGKSFHARKQVSPASRRNITSGQSKTSSAFSDTGNGRFGSNNPFIDSHRLFDESDNDDDGSGTESTDDGDGGSSSESSSGFEATQKAHSPIQGQYDPNDYANLDVSDEIGELFQYIPVFKPQEVEIETPLKCFIPSYIPAIGEVDPFLKIPRPDGKKDSLGLTVLDEPAAVQSDAAVLELQLRSLSKKRHGDVMVRSIENAANNPKDITDWIESIEKLHVSQPPPEVHYKKSMPSIEQLMSPWPADFEAAIKKGEVKLPDIDLDLSIEEYARILCSILGIPVYEGNILDSVHLMMNLYLHFREIQA